jgi:hypothetical protein
MPAKNDGKGSTVTSVSLQLHGKCNCRKQTVNNTAAAARKARFQHCDGIPAMHAADKK